MLSGPDGFLGRRIPGGGSREGTLAPLPPKAPEPTQKPAEPQPTLATAEQCKILRSFILQRGANERDAVGAFSGNPHKYTVEELTRLEADLAIKSYEKAEAPKKLMTGEAIPY